MPRTAPAEKPVVDQTMYPKMLYRHPATNVDPVTLQGGVQFDTTKAIDPDDHTGALEEGFHDTPAEALEASKKAADAAAKKAEKADKPKA